MNKNFNSIYSEIDSVNYSVLKRETLQVMYDKISKDQIKHLKKNIKLKNIKKNDLIFWKGHVAVAISKTKIIHAYGPEKKTIIMNLQNAINRIERTAKLKVVSIKRLKF